MTVLVGVFAIYWYWVIIKDYNEHFKAQWGFGGPADEGGPEGLSEGPLFFLLFYK